MEFFEHRLENGLTIIAECNPQAHSQAVGFFVCAGSRDETDDIAGVSHFLEHMVFKGTETRTVDDVNRELDELSPHYNAATSEETTVYYAMALPECQDRIVSLWSDVLRPALRSEDFDTEKQVIVEEILKYDDQPPFGADDRCRALYFGDHPLGRSILGTVESINGLKVEAMRAYFQRQYGADNVVLAAAGRVDFDALVDTARRCCGHWEPGGAARRLDLVAPAKGFHVLHKPIATQEYVLILSAAPQADDRQRFAAELLAMVLGDDSGSRLFWELVDPGLADHVGVGYREHQGAGVMMTSLGCEPELVGENLRRLTEVFRAAQKDGVTGEELETAKNKFRARMVLSSERPGGRLFALAGDWVYRGRYHRLDDDLEAVAAVTVDDVADLLAKYPVDEATTVAIGPLEDVPPA